MAFVPNPLGNFNSYAPNIDVTIGPESSKDISVSQLAPGQGVTIASTGKTANFYVDKATIRNIPTTSNNNISTTVIGIVLEILEPMGFTFFDKYFASIYSLGWQNASEAMIFVTVSFNGWFENGAASPRSFKNVWKCMVTDIKVDVEASASKYTMSLQIMPTESLESQNHIVDRSFTSEIKEKFEDTIKELERTFNSTGSTRDPANRLGENDRIYEFRVGPRLLEEDPRMPVNLQSGRTSVQLGPDGRPTYVVNSGITITEMLTTLALNITGIARILNPKLDEDYNEDTEQPVGAEIMQYFSVHVEAGYSRFDPVRNRYIRVLRYTIDLAYRPELEHQPINEMGKRERAMAYIKYGLLKKRYDYIFTGKNTEVLDLKIDFNSVYSQLLTSYAVQNPQSLAPNMDEENRNRETGQDVVQARSQNLSNILSGIANFFSGGGIEATGRLMETMQGSGILATLLNYTHAPTVPAEQARRGVNVPMDNDHARNVAAGADVDARANARSAYTEIQPLNSMVRLKLGIRGDPYWIGTSYTQRTSSTEAQNNADYYIGTQMFYIKFRLGEPHNERTGLTANLGKVTFNGIYHVTHVLSVFESGKFTQTLDGFIDVGTLGVEF